jgi:hypothetical protein
VNALPRGAATRSGCARRRNGYGSSLSVVRVHLEVEVRMDPVRVARVADVPDLLTGLHPRPVLEPLRVRDARPARAAVVVPGGEVVVEVDVEVCRPAVAVQVEHAAGSGRGRPERDRPALGGDGGRLSAGEDVVSLVLALSARLAEVVVVRHRADDGEDDRRRRGDSPRRVVGGVRGGRPAAMPSVRVRKRAPPAVVRRVTRGSASGWTGRTLTGLAAPQVVQPSREDRG